MSEVSPCARLATGASIGRALARRLSNGLKAGIQRLIEVVSVVRRINLEPIETITVSEVRNADRIRPDIHA